MPTTPERLKELLAQIEAIAEELKKEIAANGPPPAPEPRASFEGLEVGIEVSGFQEDGFYYVDVDLVDIGDKDQISSVAMEIESTDSDLVYDGYDEKSTIMNTGGWIHRTNTSNGRLGGFASRMHALDANGQLARLRFRINGPVDAEVRIKNLALHSIGRGKVRTNTDLVLPVVI